ncbi:MAG: hypothetical protein ACLFQ0_00325 [Cyclobacteriaceae bacterium]
MKQHEFNSLKKNLFIEGEAITQDQFEEAETHTSYILLTRNFAFKIKKSVNLPFLDFSTLAQREFFCRRELFLNRRLAPEIYLDVCQLRQYNEAYEIGGSQGELIDYAVKMKRMDNSREMDQLLKNKQLNNQHIMQLAEVISRFHVDAFAINKVFSLEKMRDTFNQIASWQKFAKEHLGNKWEKLIAEAVRYSDRFLEQHIDELNQRSRLGLVRDVHGDLHSQNIFIFEKPVIFDCLEFDDDLRQIDLMNEVAFFMMDLEYWNAEDLARSFLHHYDRLMHQAGMEQAVNKSLLRYFMLYRATVKAKVNFIKADHAEGEQDEEAIKNSRRYLELCEKYLE